MIHSHRNTLFPGQLCREHGRLTEYRNFASPEADGGSLKPTRDSDPGRTLIGNGLSVSRAG